MDIKSLIRTVPNFPKKGIMFRDISTLLKDPKGFEFTINNFYDRYKNFDIDYIAGIESRGFILGAALAYKMGKGFIPVRKKGKLPGETISQEYDLEYGTDILEIHTDAFTKGANILLIDDLMATGGTAVGAIDLIHKLEGKVCEFAVVIELPALNGAAKLVEKSIPFFTLVEFEGE